MHITKMMLEIDINIKYHADRKSKKFGSSNQENFVYFEETFNYLM